MPDAIDHISKPIGYCFNTIADAVDDALDPTTNVAEQVATPCYLISG